FSAISDVANTLTASVPRLDRSEDTEEEESHQRPADRHEDAIEPVTWRKATIPFRQDQLDRLTVTLARWTAEKRVKMSAAEVIRLGLDKMLRAMEEEPDEIILELYQQELREIAATEKRKYSRSRGAKKYLVQQGKL
ncbi:hypothetical protein LCGC14_0926030, partial [marine sediment metagenome]